MSTDNGAGQEDFGGGIRTSNFKPIDKQPLQEGGPVNSPPPVGNDDRLKTILDAEARIDAKLKELDQKISQSVAPTQIGLAQEIAKALREEKGPYRPEEVDDEADYDEKGTPFFCFSIAKFIGDDVRKGRTVYPPKKGLNSNDLIEFKFEMSKMVKSGKQVDLIVVAKFVSYSHKLTKWMKEHSEFGVAFFERLPAKLDMGSVTFARVMARNGAYLKDLPAPLLKNRCVELGVPVSEDIDVMRNALAIEMTKRDFVQTDDDRLIPKEFAMKVGAQFNDEDKVEMLEARKTRAAGYGTKHLVQGERVDISIVD